MSEQLVIGKETFPDAKTLPLINGRVRSANSRSLRVAHLDTINGHAAEMSFHIPPIILDRLVVASLDKRMKQAAKHGFAESSFPFSLDSPQSIARVRKKVPSIMSGALEVAAYSRMGGKDLFDAKIGEAVARVVRNFEPTHEGSVEKRSFKVIDFVQEGNTNNENAGYAIVTTKDIIATLESASRIMDVVSRQAGYIDVSKLDNPGLTTSLKIMGRAHDFGLAEGYNDTIEAARKAVASLFVDETSDAVSSALGSVYINVEAVGESQPELHQ